MREINKRKDYSPAEIEKIVAEKNVRFIRMQFTDMFGKLKNIVITPSQLQKALRNQMMFDGSSIEGFVRIEESDMFLHPDLATFAIFPWQNDSGNSARFICDIYDVEGNPFSGDPRQILRRVLAHGESLGYVSQVGPEMEFFLFMLDSKGQPTNISYDGGGYFDLGPVDLGEDARHEMVIALEDMGFEVEAAHHEVAPAQHEIDFKYANALISADQVMTFKYVLQVCAKRNGLISSFIPKPFAGQAGSGMHLNISLDDKEGRNIFYDEDDEIRLSAVARKFMAGILAHAPGLTAILNPLVNSYKRFVPGFEAPCYIAWSVRNRSPLIRIPTVNRDNARIELRSPDPSANPYLALALCLAAGFDGIERDLPLPEPINLNIYELSDEEREAMGIKRLPRNLYEAVEALMADHLLTETLGSHLCTKYVEAKLHEWEEYSAQITDWEMRHYLGY